MSVVSISWITFIAILVVNVNGSICGSDEQLQYDLSHDPDMQGRMDAIEEHWRHNPNHDGHQIDLRRRLQSLPSPIEIPINFIITRGPFDPYIGYEQIISQIRALNKDFQGSNADKGQNGRGSMSEFAHLAGDFDIKFALNKIKRKNTLTIKFNENTNEMKFDSMGGQNNEDPEHALNIWVNSFFPDEVIGFATFPGGAWNLDGVVIKSHVDSNVFGSDEYDRNDRWSLKSNYRFGRTASHEIGHWLNLIHIWGDGDCSHDDGVSDTPVDDDKNFGCPADGKSSCGTNDMYMNYMDYTQDTCKNMFTIGQVDRGQDLFLPGGFRHKLIDYVANPTEISFVDYFYFVYDNGAECDNGHTRRDLDLNKAAGGLYIYLCISYSRNPYVDVITDIDIITGDSSDISCNSGYEKIDTDLNEDAGGDYIYICYKKESQETANTIITDLNPLSFGSEPWFLPKWAGYTLELVDLNKAAGGDYIYLGFKKVHALESINFGQVKSGSITANNKKLYRITLTQNEYQMHFETCGSNYDTYLYFYDEDLNLLKSGDDENEQGTSCGNRGDLEAGVPIGTWYVGIGGYASNHGSYKLSMTHGSLSCGSSATGNIESYGKDYYQIHLDSSYQQIFIETCNPGTEYDTWLYFYDENMNLLHDCDDCNDHNGECSIRNRGDLTMNNINAGTYFVGIGGYSSSSGNYQLTLTCNNAISAGVEFVNAIDNNKKKPVYRYKNKYFIIELSNYDILIIMSVSLLLLVVLSIVTYKKCIVGESKNRYNPVKIRSDSEVDVESQEIANLN